MDDLNRLYQKLDEFKTVKFGQTLARGQTKTSMLRKQLNSVKSMKSMIARSSRGTSKKEERDFGYTVDAAKRTEQRKLEKFINMADFRMCDAIYTVLASSLQAFLFVLQGCLSSKDWIFRHCTRDGEARITYRC